MLGLGPIASRSISGSPFKLTAVTASMAATLTIAFNIGGLAGLPAPMSATLGINFGLTGRMIVQQKLAANLTITFGGAPNLRLLGKPITLVALPQSYAVRAMNDSFAVKALPQSYTIRGVR